MAYGRKKKRLDSPGGLLPNNVIFEEVQTKRAPQFAMNNKEGGIDVVPYIELNDIVYNPMVPSPWILPPPPQEYGSPLDLWHEIYDFTYDHLDIMDEELYHIYVGWVLHTWVTERFDSVPYLHFFGERNTGKTRALDLLNLLCYRPMLSPSVSGAAVYYAMDYYHPTLLLDEFEMYEKQQERKAEVIGVLNAGYRRGQGVFRVGGVSDGNPTLKRFSVFGPKALSSIEDLPPALDSRCIKFTMARAYKKVKRMIDKVKAEELRGKLLQYRFDHLFDPIPTNIDYLDLPDGRLIELYFPLDNIAPSEEISDTILKCARGQYNVTISNMRDQKPALVFHLILDMIERRISVGLPFETIPQKEIREEFNQDLSPQSYERISKQKLPGILNKLHLKTAQNPRTRLKEIVIEASPFERHKTSYVTADELTRVDELIDKIRGNGPVHATLDTLHTLGTTGGKQGSVKNDNEGGVSLQEEGNKEIGSVSSNSSVSSVSNEGSVEVKTSPSIKIDKKCASCGIPLNNQTGMVFDNMRMHYYCSPCWAAEKRARDSE